MNSLIFPLFPYISLSFSYYFSVISLLFSYYFLTYYLPFLLSSTHYLFLPSGSVRKTVAELSKIGS